LGFVQVGTNRAIQGIAECERALALDPNMARAHAMIGLGKNFSGRPDETEAHVKEALRLSPRDDFASQWMLSAGAAKLHLRADEEAVAWLGRSIESDRNWPLAHFFLAAALANLGRLEEARAATQAGLALDPTFTIRRFQLGAASDNPRFMSSREHFYAGMRKAGIPEQ
jgi:tetratricopeptide (TPR) repeat protein